MYVITEVAKEKQIITITVDNDKQIIVNLGEQTIRNITKRKVAYIKLSLVCGEGMEKYLPFIRIISHPIHWETLDQLETFWNVLDLVDEIPEENPKGYIKFVKENNKRISRRTLTEFKREQRLQGLSELNRVDWELITRYVDCFSPRIELFSNEDIEKICKIFRNSTKNKRRIFCLHTDMDDLFHQLFNFHNGSYKRTEMWKYLDTERDVHYNIKKFDMIQHAERNAKIIANESIITPIAQIETDTMCVVVPTEIEQFTNEGEQQRNCVGYFYHDSIANDKTFIYFIRLKKNKDKSYVTCRYDRTAHKTIEHRYYGNDWCFNSNVLELIKTIDEMIHTIEKQQNGAGYRPSFTHIIWSYYRTNIILSSKVKRINYVHKLFIKKIFKTT